MMGAWPALVCAVAVAQGAPASGPIRTRELAPTAIAGPGHRVHLYVSEELDADVLGSLAKRGVVLWLQMRSNALKPAVEDKLRRFGEAWVEVRAPLLPTHVASLAKAPKAGLWLRRVAELTPAMTTLGVKRISVDVVGPLEAGASDALASAKVERVRWAPPVVDLEAFGRFAQLPAEKALVLPTGAAIPACESRLSLGQVEVIAAPAQVRAAIRCGLGVRVVVEPESDDRLLAEIFRVAPSAQLEIRVGADERRATRTRRLLERLEAASGPSQRPKR